MVESNCDHADDLLDNNSCTKGFVIIVRNLGSHAETSVPYRVSSGGGPARTYGNGCSGNAAAFSPDGDLDPHETVLAKGCTITYSSGLAGTYLHMLTVDHGSGSAQFSDNSLANNRQNMTTTVVP